jgi:large subunit ribosomal protein L29
MRVKEIRELAQEELKNKIDDTRRQILEMRFQLATRKLDSPAKLRTARKTLARLLTIRGQQENQKGQ